MKEKNYSGRYRLYYLITLSALCCYDTYVSVYLEQYLHMSGVQIGAYLALTMVFGMVLMPFYGRLGDKSGKYREILMVCTGGTILFSFLLSLQTGFFLTLLVGIGFELNRCPILSLADTQTVSYCTAEKRNYGSIRNFGCAGWTLGSLCCAFLVKRFTLGNVFFRFFIGVMAASLVIQIFLPRVKRSAPETPEKGAKKESGGFKTLLSNKRYLFLLAFVLVTGAVNECVGSYVSLHLVSTLHSEEYIVSVYSVITPIPEFLFLLCMNKYVMPKLGFRGLYILSAAALAARMFLFAVIPSVPLFLVVAFFSFLTSACQTGVNIQFIRRIVPETLIGSAAALFNACFMGGRAIFSLLFGLVYDAAGSRMIFVVCGILSAAGLLAVIAFRSLDSKAALINEA